MSEASVPVRRWMGIDEAGYGPNLGPLVMTAVEAEGRGEGRPELWRDLEPRICRAGGPADRLWVDDSKRLFGSARGLDRLRDATRAAIEATGAAAICEDDRGLLGSVRAGDLEATEWARWLGEDGPARLDWGDRDVPLLATDEWRIRSVRSRVVGPRRFNKLISGLGNKAAAHGQVFLELLSSAWTEAGSLELDVLGDKHGGRNTYYAMLVGAFPGAWIERGEEGARLSRYTLREGPRRLGLALRPKADQDDGLVALASIISKYLRERWMASFNAFWEARVPGLRRTAGYPVDARRFRAEIEAEAQALGFQEADWWRTR